ncbi:MAG TPA: trehalase family glycosidase, partial [Steroidobacteraceae bacterium]|nr:trehalase family glycosidase [Steroidobacteraceae bacterium]
MSGVRVRRRSCLGRVCLAVLVTLGAVAAAQTPLPPQAGAPAPSATPKTPYELFDGLFVAVQMAALYPDGKAFPDAIPQASPETILSDYRRLAPGSSEALKDFVAAHFRLPAEQDAPPTLPAGAPITAHIDALWSVLTRETAAVPRWSSLLPLPRPFVVPGGRFREMYYWDSYFTMLGLSGDGHAPLMRDMLENFAYLIDTFGHVPNGNRIYYLSRSQPPVFALMVELAQRHGVATEVDFLPQLRKEHAFWMNGSDDLAEGRCARRVVRLPGGALLNRYWDERDTPR